MWRYAQLDECKTHLAIFLQDAETKLA